MFWIGIAFLLLVAVFGLRVFTAIRWIVGLCILAVIALLLFASLHPAKQDPAQAQPAAAPLVKWGVMTEKDLAGPSPTPTVTPEVKLFDYSLDN
jgi:hypothetical protein